MLHIIYFPVLIFFFSLMHTFVIFLKECLVVLMDGVCAVQCMYNDKSCIVYALYDWLYVLLLPCLHCLIQMIFL